MQIYWNVSSQLLIVINEVLCARSEYKMIWLYKRILKEYSWTIIDAEMFRS